MLNPVSFAALPSIRAVPADQECGRVALAQMRARNKGVEPFNLMGEPVLDQEVQGPIRDRWL